MKRKLIGLLLLCACILFSGCRSDSNSSVQTGNSTTETPGTETPTSQIPLLKQGIICLFSVFNLDSTKTLVSIITIWPFFVPPVSCIGGMVYGAICLRRKPDALRCLLLSVLGLLMYVGLWYLCGWIGSRY